MTERDGGNRRTPHPDRPQRKSGATGSQARDRTGADRGARGRPAGERRQADDRRGGTHRADPRRDDPRGASGNRRAASADRASVRPTGPRDGGEQIVPVGPSVPADLGPEMLDNTVRGELRGLSKEVADDVAVHLVAAGVLLDDDVALSLEHARYARARARRVGAVREAVGIAAYAAGEYAEALAELRAARRMNGDPSCLAMISDCERALGRPQRALKALDDPDFARLDPEDQVEVMLVVAGARRDLGQHDAALVALERAGLSADPPGPSSARVWYAYADTLAEMGRSVEAATWFNRVAELDDEFDTDAAERAAELTK